MKDTPHLFSPTRQAALARLEAFIPQSGKDYTRLRNYDLPGHPHVSGLSPYIRHRVITEAEVARAVLTQFSANTAEKFLQEVCWRSYWKAWLERRPGVWQQYLAALPAAQNRLATEPGLRARFEDACLGKTGIDGFDDWAEELVQTGYLHNHARMWFASIWIFTLGLPWVLGADFFLRHLLDGDPASNTLSWRWVAGIQTPGKTYAARAANIAKYTQGRANPVHQLVPVDRIIPCQAPALPTVEPVPESAPIQPNLKTGLLVTEDDLSADFLLDRIRPEACAILIAPKGRSPLPVSSQVIAFTQALAVDTATRLSELCGHDVAIYETADALRGWIEDNGLEQVVLPYTPVGPATDILKAVAEMTDVPLQPQLRRWDAAALPFATAGFFKFKARIPQLLETL